MALALLRSVLKRSDNNCSLSSHHLLVECSSLLKADGGKVARRKAGLNLSLVPLRRFEMFNRAGQHSCSSFMATEVGQAVQNEIQDDGKVRHTL